jgi:hypothetical protein
MPLHECCLSCKMIDKSDLIQSVFVCYRFLCKEKEISDERERKVRNRNLCHHLRRWQAWSSGNQLFADWAKPTSKEKSIYIEFWNHNKKWRSWIRWRKTYHGFVALSWWENEVWKRERANEGLYFKGFRIWVWPLLASG